MHQTSDLLQIPMETVNAISASLSANVRVDVHVYPGVVHGFSFAGQPNYHEVAATTSDRCAQEVLTLLKSAV